MAATGKNLGSENIDNPFLLDGWLDAIEELKKTDPKIYEELEEYADKQWASYIADELEVSDDPLELINNYLNLISEKGIINRNDFKVGKKGNKIIIDISGNYSPIIRRGSFLIYLIEIANEKIFDFDGRSVGNTYKIELSPGVFTLKVVLSYKIGRGSINISDKDITKLGMDMIESVSLVPVGKETGIGEMMFSSSRVMQGHVVMNIADASLLGLREGSKVELIKKESEEDTEKEEAGDSEEKTQTEKEETNQEEKEQDVEEEKEETIEEEKTVEKEKSQTQETQTPKKEIQKEPQKPESQPKLQKQKQEIKDVKKPNIPKKQTTQDKTKQMKDFEAKIDVLRGK